MLYLRIGQTILQPFMAWTAFVENTLSFLHFLKLYASCQSKYLYEMLIVCLMHLKYLDIK